MIGVFDGVGRICAGFASVVVFLFLAAPIGILVTASFGSGQYLEFPPPGLTTRWYREFFADPQWPRALVVSTVLALVVAATTTTAAATTAWWFDTARWRALELVGIFFLFPAVLPVIIFAVAYYVTFANVTLAGPWTKLALAHVVLAFPFSLVILRAGMANRDRTLEDAARVLGARPVRVALAATVPAIRWHLAAAALLAFVISFTEPIVAIFLTSGDTATLPQKTWEGVRFGLDPTTAVASTFLLYGTLFGTIVATAAAGRRRRTAQRRLARRVGGVPMRAR